MQTTMALNSLSGNYEKQVCLTSRTIWRYNDAHYAKACQMIDKIEWDGLLHEDDVDRSAINWNNKFMDVMSTCIPQQSLKRRRNVPWLTMNISRHIRMRNAAFQAARKFAKPARFLKYRKLRNKVVKMMSAKSSYFKNLNPRNKKHFWKAIKYLSKQQSTIPILTYQDTTAKCDFEKASLLNEFFQHVLTEIFLLSHLRIMIITLCNTTYVQISYFVQLVKFSF